MSNYDEDEEETGEGEWQEHWIVVGSVSDLAREAIELVNGKVAQLYTHTFNSGFQAVAVCFLYADDDDETGFSFSNHDDALYINASTPDENIDLVLYSIHPNPDRDVSDVTGLHLITEGEWFKLDEERVAARELLEKKGNDDLEKWYQTRIEQLTDTQQNS